jgi:hypothetical protein
MTHHGFITDGHKRLKPNWLALGLAITLSLVLIGFATYVLHNKPRATDTAAVIMTASPSSSIGNPYSNWPPAGTQPALPGEPLFEAQGIIALTCRDGKAHIDENMVVDSTLRPGVKPSWFVGLYVSYDQSRNQGFCEIKAEPYGEVKLLALKNYKGLDGFAETSPQSISVEIKDGNFALLLVNTGDKRVKPGIPIKLGTNGIPAPPRELLKS